MDLTITGSCKKELFKNSASEIRIEMIEKKPAITAGYGEFVAYKLDGINKVGLDFATYEKVHQILRDYQEELRQGQHQEVSKEYLLKRINLLDKEISIEFTPRSLYELIYLNHVANETPDKVDKPCLSFGNSNQELIIDYTDRNYEEFKTEVDTSCYRFGSKEKNIGILKEHQEGKCCHVFNRRLSSKKDFNEIAKFRPEQVNHVAWKINNIVIDLLELYSLTSPINYEMMEIFAEKEIEKNGQLHLELKKKLDLRLKNSWDLASPEICIALEKTYGTGRPYGIYSKRDKNILLNMLAVECSEVGRKNLLLYRGQNRNMDLQDGCHSYSFGTGPYGGCMYDSGATAFTYMKDEHCESIIQPIPLTGIKESIFYYPSAGIIDQCNSSGEFFHGRSKIWKHEQNESIAGWMSSGILPYKDWIDELKIPLEEDEFLKKFEKECENTIIVMNKN